MGGCECKNSNHPTDFDDVATEDTTDAAPQFMVQVVGARNVRGPDWFPGVCKSDCFCVVSSLQRGEVLFKTNISRNEVEPCWKEEFQVNEALQSNGGLEFAIWHSIYTIDPRVTLPEGTKERLVGKARLFSSRFSLAGFNGDLELQHCAKDISGALMNVKVGLVGQAYPPPPPLDFHLNIENPSSKTLGIDLDTQDQNTVYVENVRPMGLVDVHNSNSKPTERLLAGHFIMQVNGVQDRASMLIEGLGEEMKRLPLLRLVVRRPFTLCVAVNKRDKKTDIGICFNRTSHAGCLVITQISPGPVMEWNRKNPGREVLLGDRVTAVNGVKGKPSDMAKKMKSLERFIMTVVRRHPDPEE